MTRLGNDSTFKFPRADIFDTAQWTYKLHCEAKNIGFYWTSTDQILDNITSEVTEIREAIAHQESKNRIGEEIGDLYLGVLELCYYLGLNPETILQKSLIKFDKRLNLVKEGMRKRSIAYLDSKSTDLALELWRDAKLYGAVEED